MAFANEPWPSSREDMENQLGDVMEVTHSGYPQSIQTILNALRVGYCVHGTIGDTDNGDTLEFDAEEPCEIVEAVPVDYALETEFVPEVADKVWKTEFTESQSEGEIPQARVSVQGENGPAADVYVFPKELQVADGLSLLEAMGQGVTHHLEEFTANFTGAFEGGVIDVLFIAPADRPYFAVYSLGRDHIDLSHELRTELNLPVVHHGQKADPALVYDIRYNPHYVRRETSNSEDVLVAVGDEETIIDIEAGTVEGDAFEISPDSHELVVTGSENGKKIEIARLRAPTARLGMAAEDRVRDPGQMNSSGGTVGKTDDQRKKPEMELPECLSRRDVSRLADIAELQPTSNSELADRWGLAGGSEVYQYLSSALDDHYYRDAEKYIRVTDQGKRILQKFE